MRRKMHRKAGLPFVVLLAFCWVPTTGRAAEPTAAGLWEKRDDSGQPQGWFRIADRNGAYQGQIVKMFPKPGQDPASWRCTKCDGEQKDAPVLGITFIKGMKRQGLAYENGKILDPRDGSTYSARMAPALRKPKAGSVMGGYGKRRCRRKAKMSALSKVKLSVSYPLGSRDGGGRSDERGADEQTRTQPDRCSGPP